MIGLSGAFDNGGVCGEGERFCKCSSLIVSGDGTSSRSQSIDDKFVGIWAIAIDAGEPTEARGDNSGNVGVLDIANSDLFAVRLDEFKTLLVFVVC